MLSSEHGTPQNRSLHHECEQLHLTPTPTFPFVVAEDSFSLYSSFYNEQDQKTVLSSKFLVGTQSLFLFKKK